MPPRIDDRWLWLGLGVFSFFAALGIRHAIKDVVRLTEIEHEQRAPLTGDDRGLEESITLETLRTLASSPNYHISRSAIQIVVQRFARDPSSGQGLLADFKQMGDPELRRRARLALPFLNDFVDEFTSHYSRNFAAPDASSDDRPRAESLPTVAEALDLVEEEQAGPSIRDEASGPRPSLASVATEPDSMIDEIFADIEAEIAGPSRSNVASVPFAGWDLVPTETQGLRRPWSRSNLAVSEDEVERRRRRREAMVLHEGEGDVGPQDIIRPR